MSHDISPTSRSNNSTSSTIISPALIAMKANKPHKKQHHSIQIVSSNSVTANAVPGSTNNSQNTSAILAASQLPTDSIESCN